MLIDFIYAILKDNKVTNWNDFYFLLLAMSYFFSEAWEKKHNEEAKRGEADIRN